MDAIDQQILAEVQENGRLTITELADRVGLSLSPCHRRLRELESSGTIRGYRAVLDPAAVGLGFEVLVSVTMRQEDRRTLLAFEEAVREIPAVTQAQRLFGDPDYLLRVAATDLDDYAALRDHELATLPGVQRITSTLVMKRIVDNRPLPLAATRSRTRQAPAGGRGVRPGRTQLPGMIIIRKLLHGHESQHPSPRHQAEVDRGDWLHIRNQEEPQKRS